MRLVGPLQPVLGSSRVGHFDITVPMVEGLDMIFASSPWFRAVAVGWVLVLSACAEPQGSATPSSDTPAAPRSDSRSDKAPESLPELTDLADAAGGDLGAGSAAAAAARAAAEAEAAR